MQLTETVYIRKLDVAPEHQLSCLAVLVGSRKLSPYRLRFLAGWITSGLEHWLAEAVQAGQDVVAHGYTVRGLLLVITDARVRCGLLTAETRRYLIV